MELKKVCTDPPNPLNPPYFPSLELIILSLSPHLTRLQLNIHSGVLLWKKSLMHFRGKGLGPWFLPLISECCRV